MNRDGLVWIKWFVFRCDDLSHEAPAAAARGRADHYHGGDHTERQQGRHVPSQFCI
jgi:hypothetical protein